MYCATQINTKNKPLCKYGEYFRLPPADPAFLMKRIPVSAKDLGGFVENPCITYKYAL